VLVLLVLELLQLLLGVADVLALLELLLELLLLLLGGEVELSLREGLAGDLLERGPGRRVVFGRVRLIVLGKRRGRTRVLALLLDDELVVLRVFVLLGGRQ
jgi:hypothetical protein